MKNFILTLLIAALAMAAISVPALADRQIDEEGAYVYDYDKSPYDEIIFGGRTYGQFLKSHGNTSYDFEHFVNSEFGEIYARYAHLGATYPDNMDENLLAYWREIGMEKTLVRPEGAEDNQQDYYVYTPVDMDAAAQYPLVIVNHGGGANARSCESFGWIDVAAQEKLILVMAEDTEAESLRRILDEVKAAYPVDESRVYLTGSSQGARRSKKFAGLYPNEIAAIAPMNAPFAFFDGDGDAQQLAALKMPIIITTGSADKYYILPVHEEGNDAASSHGSFEGWNTLVTMQGFEEYVITAEESAALLEQTTNLLEHYTGLRLPEAIVYNHINNRTFQCNFTNGDGVTMLSLVIEENGSHDPIGYDAQISWDYMKQFARDTQTGELIVLP